MPTEAEHVSAASFYNLHAGWHLIIQRQFIQRLAGIENGHLDVHERTRRNTLCRELA
jgi:hypothetical protein